MVRTWERIPARHERVPARKWSLARRCALPGVPAAKEPEPAGRVQEFTWKAISSGTSSSTDKQLPHHDILRLPNGNVLMIVWDRKTAQKPSPPGVGTFAAALFLLDCLMESSLRAERLARWCGGQSWNHLVQDHDSSKANYGNVAEHPERVDINFWMDVVGLIARSKEGMDKLKSIGYVASGAPAKPAGVNPDWSHFNSVAYNPELDQIAVSVHALSELWIIDHSTTKAQAAGHVGGRSGKGGDLLYRWGNPNAYRAGTKADRRLFAQHDAHWIPRRPPAGDACWCSTTAGYADGAFQRWTSLFCLSTNGARAAGRSGPTGRRSRSGLTRSGNVRLLFILLRCKRASNGTRLFVRSNGTPWK